jgi:hypothetical protein
VRLEWILMAEGFGSNASGALTAIALNQNVLVTPSLPVTTKRAILAHFVVEGEEAHTLADQEITVSSQVIGPSNETVLASSLPGRFPRPAWPDLPVGLDIIFEFPLRITEYGTYEIRVSTRAISGDEIRGHINLHVRQPLPLGPTAQTLPSGPDARSS